MALELNFEGSESSDIPSPTISNGKERPDWKQWIPLWGAYQIAVDGRNKLPTIVGSNDSKISFREQAAFVYTGATTVAGFFGIACGLDYLLQKILS